MSKGVYPNNIVESVVAPELRDEVCACRESVDSGFRHLALVRKSFQIRRNDICSGFCDLIGPLDHISVVYRPDGVNCF